MRLIDGDALKAKFCNHCDKRDCKPDETDTVYGCVIADMIDNMPTIDKDVKKPICFVYDHLGGTPYVCPSCGGTLYDSDWYESTKREYRHDRCVHCGQSIDWEAENISEYKGRTAYSRPNVGGDSE